MVADITINYWRKMYEKFDRLPKEERERIANSRFGSLTEDPRCYKHFTNVDYGPDHPEA